jgi:membrane protein YqaA with SNARE-associated domain
MITSRSFLFLLVLVWVPLIGTAFAPASGIAVLKQYLPTIDSTTTKGLFMMMVPEETTMMPVALGVFFSNASLRGDWG